MTVSEKSPAEVGPQLKLCKMENVEKAIRKTIGLVDESRDVNLLEWAQAFKSVQAGIAMVVQTNCAEMLGDYSSKLESDDDESDEPTV